MAKKADIRAKRKGKAAAKVKARVENNVSDEVVRASGSNKIGNNRDGGAMAAPGEARPRTSRRLANDQPCMLIHSFTNRFHTITMHILSVPLRMIVPVTLMILHATMLIQSAPTPMNPLLVSAFILVLGSDLFLELARFAPMKAVIDPPATKVVRFPSRCGTSG